MRKIIRFAQAHTTGQGLVEFALALPVLLLLILGIFAFGHFFFTYSSIVSASREASRYGAAVGQSGGPFPRYKDCDAIRAAAVRVGSFAGVTPATVAITYDAGPDDPTTPKPVCPTAAGSQGPDVALGNRINISITVQYTPIVAFLQLPSFPITATSSRTILLGLPVGDVPTAVSIYPTTTLAVTVNGNPVDANNPGSSSIVGQVFTIDVTVTASDSTIPTGVIYIGDDSSPTQTCTMNLVSGSASCSTYVYHAVTTDSSGVDHPHAIGIRYDPNGAHYNPANPSTVFHTVSPATSTTTITSVNPPSPGAPTQNIVIKTHVAPQFTGVPTGKVDLLLADNSVVATQTLDASGNATFNYLPTFTGDNTFTVHYLGDPNFIESKTASYPYHVESLDVNISLSPLTGTANSPVPFIVTVSSATGTGGTPSGTVFLNDAEGHSCTVTLNASGVGNCSLTFSTVKAYTFTANYSSSNLTFKNKSATFTFNIIDKTATYIQLAPASSTITPNSTMTFTVTVTQADGKVPNGTVGIASSLQPGNYVCTTTLNNTSTGTCTVPAASLPLGGPYSFQATFNPSNSTTYAASLSNVATVTVASNCPTYSSMNSSGSSINFSVNNTSPGNINLTVSQIVVNWPSVPSNPLNDIRFIDAANIGGMCDNSNKNVACLWLANNKTVSPPSQTISSSQPGGTSWQSNNATLAAGATKVFQLDFANAVAGGYSTTITFNNGCSLSAP